MNFAYLVNKDHFLPSCFEPAKLYTLPNNKKIDARIIAYYIYLKEEALKNGFNITIDSAYRSYLYQEKLFKESIKEKGVEETLKMVAIPGASEHQTGLAIDLGYYDKLGYHEDVSDNPLLVDWLKDNSYKYGFILRYLQNKEHITLYKYEPWHFRFVGIPLAYVLKHNNLTLEEYYLNPKKYQNIISNFDYPNIVTYAQICALLLLLKKKVSLKELANFINIYKQKNPNTIVVSSSLNYIKGLQKKDNYLYINDIDKDELIYFINDELFDFVYNDEELSRKLNITL